MFTVFTPKIYENSETFARRKFSDNFLIHPNLNINRIYSNINHLATIAAKNRVPNFTNLQQKLTTKARQLEILRNKAIIVALLQIVDKFF